MFDSPENLHECDFYEKSGENLKCLACHRFCVIPENKTGYCGIRKNIQGKLYLLTYNKTATLQVDSIEKKPFAKFKQRTTCLGISTFGCNFSCKYCQNWSLSQTKTEQAINKMQKKTPEELIQLTLSAGAQGIAYTYNEPTIFAEFALDVMKLAKENNLYNVWVSNGFMSNQVIEAITPFLDAINIDLKGSNKFYQDLCGGVNKSIVEQNIKTLAKKKIHIELTNLIIPKHNDSEKDFEELADFILSINPSIPIHLTRFFPMHKLTDVPTTPIKTILKAKKFLENKGLEFVFTGNF